MNSWTILARIGVSLAPPVRIWILAALLLHATPAAAQRSDVTQVVILGVEHSGQYFVERYRPGVLRAWLERVDPDGVAVERHPDAFAVHDFYGFTLEIQDVVLPWARSRGLPVHPFDWEPSREEQQLAFGFDLQATPLLRPLEGWGAFVRFPEERLRGMHLFLGESGALREQTVRWSATPGAATQAEAARRLYLYRTLLQARRIEKAAEGHRGGTLVVVVGAMHQPDLETHLERAPGIELVPASAWGEPSAEEADRHELPEDRNAIAWLNLFGAQSMAHQPDIDWLTRVLTGLEGSVDERERALLSLRLREWKEDVEPAEAIEQWLSLAELFAAGEAPSWTGQVAVPRLDSDFDPFAGLDLRGRSLHEASRVASGLGRTEEARRLRDEVAAELGTPARIQYLGYWDRFVETADAAGAPPPMR